MATLYRRGRTWYLNWSIGGRRQRLSLGAITEREAETLRKAKEVEIETGITILSTAPLFHQYAMEYLEWYAYEYPASYKRTEQIVEQHLVPEFECTALDMIEPRRVEAWKARRQQSVKAETVTKELRVFKAMINRAVEWGIIRAHPFLHVKAPKVLDSRPPRWYSVEELRQIYGADQGYRFVWQLMANTGLRRTEALQIREADVLEDRIRVVSTQDARTKSGKWRDIPLSPAAREAVEQLSGGRHLLPRVNRVSLSRAFSRTLGRVDLDGSLHCLRHTFCSHLIMSGVPLRTVQVLAGHASFITTERYAHVAETSLAKAVEGLRL